MRRHFWITALAAVSATTALTATWSWPVALGVVVGGGWNLANLWCLAHLLNAWLGPHPSRRSVIGWLLLKFPLLYGIVLVLVRGPRPLLVGFGVGFSVVLALALSWSVRQAKALIRPSTSYGR